MRAKKNEKKSEIIHQMDLKEFIYTFILFSCFWFYYENKVWFYTIKDTCWNPGRRLLSFPRQRSATRVLTRSPCCLPVWNRTKAKTFFCNMKLTQKKKKKFDLPVCLKNSFCISNVLIHIINNIAVYRMSCLTADESAPSERFIASRPCRLSGTVSVPDGARLESGCRLCCTEYCWIQRWT